MKRTTLMIPEDLRARAKSRAIELDISLGEFIRQAIDEKLSEPSEDSLLSDTAVYEGPVPPDLSENHDRYLYGEGIDEA